MFDSHECPIPCIICGKVLTEVFDPGVNQANDALAFISHGQYGSTVFDPMDGTYLEINVCDECLVKAGEQGRVISGRDRRPVEIHPLGIVGWEKVNRPYVPWTRDTAEYDREDRCVIEVDDLDNLPDTVNTLMPVEIIRAMVEAYK